MTDVPITFPRIHWGSLPVVIALLAQTAGVVWWASGVERRVTALESAVKPVQATSETVARLDERTKATQEGIARVERKLDDMEAKPR
jgi:hypothetical protein